ncbi:MAG: anti-sigma factor antagonist [Clostridiales bacterium]|nr:anti-sigma factor antagonist [Clostridiales bacterium]MCD8153765.1 anti-sigma factor antagonist [Clostridiales bacterium]
MIPDFEIQGTTLRIHLPRELDHPAADSIRKESDKIMGRNYIRRIVFDFSDTAFMDSSGIGLIMGRYRALGMRAGCMSAVCVNRRMERLLRLGGMRRYMSIQENENGTGIQEGSTE